MKIPEFDRAEISVDADELQQHYRTQMDVGNREQAWIRSGLVALLYGILAGVNYLTLEPDVRTTAMMFALFVSLGFLGFSLFHRFVDYPAYRANLMLFLELVVLQVDAIAFNFVTDGIMSGFALYIMIVASGIFLTTSGWLVSSVLMLTTTWSLAIWVQGTPFELARETLMTVSAVMACGFFYSLRVRAARRLSEHQLMETKYRDSLESALAHIETLSGLLPICASCKSIRGEDQQWSRIEDYVSERADVEFTHSVCPACRDELYPEYSNRE